MSRHGSADILESCRMDWLIFFSFRLVVESSTQFLTTFFFLESWYNLSNTDCLEWSLEMRVVSLWFLTIEDLSRFLLWLWLFFMLMLPLLKDSLMDWFISEELFYLSAAIIELESLLRFWWLVVLWLWYWMLLLWGWLGNYMLLTFLMLFARVLITRVSMLYWKQNAFASMKGSSLGWIVIVADC